MICQKKSALPERAKTLIKQAFCANGACQKKSDPDGFPETVLKPCKNQLFGQGRRRGNLMALSGRHRILDQGPWKSLNSLAFPMVRHGKPSGPMKRVGSEYGILMVSCFPLYNQWKINISCTPQWFKQASMCCRASAFDSGSPSHAWV